MMKEQAKISKQLNKARIGQTYKVMFEGLSQESDLLFQGRLAGQTQDIDGYILINDMPEGLSPKMGGIYDVRITEAHEYDLIGELVGPPEQSYQSRIDPFVILPSPQGSVARVAVEDVPDIPPTETEEGGA